MATQDKKIRVMIVDDHQVVRQGLRTFLELQPDLVVVGEAGNGQEAVEMARQLQPDIVLMDLVMPVLDGIAATRQVKALGGQTQVIALTSFTEDDKVIPAIQAGASSYLLKDVSPKELVEAIRATQRGEARLHPNITRKLMAQVAAQTTSSPAVTSAAAPLQDLTSRELDIVRLVAQGRSNHQIAQNLVISEKTVKTHVSHILGKLDLVDRTQLAIYAIKHGLVDAS